VIKRVRPADLEETLMLLPFNSVLGLFSFLDEWISKGLSMELVTKIAYFLIRLHHTQISANPGTLLKVLLSLQKNTRAQLQQLKGTIESQTYTYQHPLSYQFTLDVVGFNKAAMGFIQRDIQLNDSSKVFI